MLPCNTNCENVPQVVAMIDGLLAPGGGDVTPFIYNCEKKSTCGKTNLADDNYDIALIKETLKQGKPVLGNLPWTANRKCHVRRYAVSGYTN